MENTSNQTINEVVKVIAEGRTRTNLFKDSEQKFIAYLVQRMPNWLSSDMLTAIVHGLNFRPLEETVADLVAWMASNEQVTTTGMTLAEETALRRRVREHSPS